MDRGALSRFSAAMQRHEWFTGSVMQALLASRLRLLGSYLDHRHLDLGSIHLEPSGKLSRGRLYVGSAEEPLLSQQAVAIWHRLDDKGHMRLVEGYLREAGTLKTSTDLTAARAASSLPHSMP